MTYREWFQSHGRRHRAIVESLPPMSAEALVDYFRYENMRQKHPDFCPLYAKNEKCHEMEDLNCYLCGCPSFRFCDEGIDRIEGKVRYSLCAVNAKDGRALETDNAIHQDCSNCLLPHRRSFILKHFDRDWMKIMEKCEACPASEQVVSEEKSPGD